MKYRVEHITRYAYQQPVSLCHNIACLCPRNLAHQQRTDWRLEVSPRSKRISKYRDYFGNRLTCFSVDELHQLLEVTAVSEVIVLPHGVDGATLSRPWEAVRDVARTAVGDMAHMIRIFTLPSPFVRIFEEVRAYALQSFWPGRPLIEATLDLTRRIYRDFTYQPGHTSVTTPVETVLQQRCGVCQDFAHVAIACLRALGLPARYISGYIENEPLPGQPKLTGADASHAWFSCWEPDLGWVDFDPTNDRMSSTQHITVAWGRDYSDVVPVKGLMTGGGAHELSVAVTVRQVR